MKNIIITSIVAAAFVGINVTSASAAVSAGTGTLYPTSAPGETMYSIEEIYNLITASTTAELGSGEFMGASDKTNGTITLKDLYEAAFALRSSMSNSTTTDNTEGDEDSETPTVTPDGSETFGFVGTTRVLDTYTSGRYGFRFNITASNVDLYMPKTVNLDYVKLNGTPATGVVSSVTAVVTSTDATDAGDYWKISPNATASFSTTITLENLGNTTALLNGVLTLTGIEYKNNSTSETMNVFNTNIAEYVLSGITLNNVNGAI
ncbi:MAG: hypothetical protein RLY49_501 [Candidatus Parcubacteria bacterium]|jgi:hypothetical protein